MQGDKEGRIEDVTTYKFKEAVNGEIATARGLIQFSYEAGSVTPKGDEEILEALCNAGLATCEDEAPKKKSTKQADVAPAIEDNETSEEN